MDAKIETRGRKSLPPEKRKAPQTTVKINNFILPFVQELKGNLKNKQVTPEIISQLFSVLNGKSEQQASVFKDPKAVSIVEGLQNKIRKLESELRIKDNQIGSLRKTLKEKIIAPFTENERSILKKQYNEEHSKALKLEGKVRTLESNLRYLKRDYDDLLHREYDCMAIKGNGDRCTKKSVVDVIQNGINIHVCLQHSKVLAKKAKE